MKFRVEIDYSPLILILGSNYVRLNEITDLSILITIKYVCLFNQISWQHCGALHCGCWQPCV
jgi:hypothetical protein